MNIRNRNRGPKPKYEHLYPQIEELLRSGRPMRKIGEDVGVSTSVVLKVAAMMDMEVIHGK